MNIFGYTLIGIIVIELWYCWSRLTDIRDYLRDHTFGQFKIECPDPSEHMKFTIGKKK